MRRTILTATVAALLLLMLVTSSGLARVWYAPDRATTTTHPDRVVQYGLPQDNAELTVRQSPRSRIPETADARSSGTLLSLGSTGEAATASPGFTVYNTYMDDQFRPPVGRMVDYRTSPDIHFTYSEASGPAANSGFGYNVYDPIVGDWPRGAGVGCRIQATDGTGRWVMMDVDPRGYVVMGGEDDAGGSPENHFYFQNAQHSCFFGGGSIIPSSQYNDGHFLNPAGSHLSHPRLEIQEWGADTILHVIAGESDPTWDASPYSADFTFGTVSYYRRVGVGGAGTWEGPTVMDTIAIGYNGSIGASRVSPKLAVSYCKYHELAFPNNQAYDTEVYMRISDSVGTSWGPPTNVTNYSRVEASHIAWYETVTFYDSEGFLHLVWNAFPTVANVYEDPTFFWGDYSASLFHWTDRVSGTNAGGTIVKVHDANWGQDYNTQVCGFGGPGSGYVAFFTLSECDGRLYCFFNQFLDAVGNWDYGPEIDDCASGGFSDRGNAANGEVAMCVSSTLDGILWDAARNLTNTYTPNCDSAGFGGVCMADYRPASARYGMDITAFDSTLKWPGGEMVDPTPEGEPAYSGNYYLHVVYLEDHFPSPGWRDPETFGRLTNNPLKWMRVACVDPIEAPQIATSEDSLGYPEYTAHGHTDTVTITVINDGNVSLSVDSIVGYENSPGPTGWLAVSDSSLSVGAGVDNTETFDLYINYGPTINDPGTIVALNGQVYLKSNALNDDSAVIKITNYLVADTVLGLELDTISTVSTPRAAEPGEFISLVVTNTGEMGFSGNGGNGTLNMDYISDGGECNPSATVYLFSGGPLVLRADVEGVDTSFVFSQAMFQNQFSTDLSFKRVIEGAESGPLADPAYDGYFTGSAVNRDSTIVMERTYYAPTTGGDSTDFIIMRTSFFSTDGAQGPLIIGESADWDVPGDEGDGATNLSGVLSAHDAVYQQGVDPDDPLCQDNANRFATIKLLGYFLNSELGEDPCAGVCVPYGAYANRNDSLFAIDDSVLADYYWEQMREHPGANAETSGDETDLHMVMTYVYDYELPASDTFTVYTVYTTVHNGDVAQLSGNLDAAFEWYRVHLRPGCEQLCGCCVGITGNVDGDAGELTDIGDLTALIAYLYIPPNPVPICPEEANIDGDSAGLIDIGDLTGLIAYLYIPPNPEPAPCQ
jgi:hypothetical protein